MAGYLTQLHEKSQGFFIGAESMKLDKHRAPAENFQIFFS